jgi:hypothetical protein
MRKTLLWVFVLFGLMLLNISVWAQNDKEKKDAKIPTGFSFGALPTV